MNGSRLTLGLENTLLDFIFLWSGSVCPSQALTLVLGQPPLPREAVGAQVWGQTWAALQVLFQTPVAVWNSQLSPHKQSGGGHK